MTWYTFLPSLLNMSLTAGVVIVFVLLARLALRRAPKIVSYVLWSVVLFRLLCPVTISAPVSLLGIFDTPIREVNETATVMNYISPDIVHTEFPAVSTPVEPVNQVINAQLPQGEEQLAADPLEAPVVLGTYVWGLGVLAMSLYAICSYFRTRKKLFGAVRLRDNLWLADHISSPFVMGLLRPKIYLPCGLKEQEQTYIIAHEQHHIRRMDHVVKLLAFLALCIHWFNPLVWVAFVLASRDMEMSCDEAVVRRLGVDVRADYAQSLLRLATGRVVIAGTPLAFGEGDTKSRIRNLANWKKPAFWVLLAAVVLCIVLMVCLVTNPQKEQGEIVIDGFVYKQTEGEENIIPDGSREIGRISGIVGTLTEDNQATGLPKRYAGLPIFRNDSFPNKIYVPTSDGVLCFASDSVSVASFDGVRLWVNYWDDPEEMNYGNTISTTLPEFPGVTFQYAPGELVAVSENGNSILFNGMPIWNVFFTDLNRDGYSEICATVSFGSGLIDEHVVVMDYYGGQLYTLWERGEYDYALRIADGVLVCDKRQYPQGELVKSGPLTLSFVRMKWTLDIGASAAMLPTSANLRGVFDGYLYLEGEDGQTYRYERSELDGGALTKGELLDMFTEKAAPNDVQWQVYAIEEIPDRTSVLAVADGVFRFRYNYSPSKAVSANLLRQAKEDGYVVLENGEPTHGQELWQEFYEATQRGEPATVKIARWYTLDPADCDATYYEAFKEDYPIIYYHEIRFDGTFYMLIQQEDNRSYIPTYEYLMRYETEVPSQVSHEEPETIIRYVLTHDDTVTWDELFQSLASSQMGAYIDHYSVYQERP